MFESQRLKHKISKAEFKTEEPRLRGDLIDAQFELLESGDFPVIVLLSGTDVLGRSGAASQLMNWMDARHINSYAMIRASDEELDRPRMWRFWRALPQKGRIGIFLNAWYEEPVTDYILGHISRDQYRQQIEEIRNFEETLVNDGALFVKFLSLLPRGEELKVMKRLKKERFAAWKVSKEEIEIVKQSAERHDEIAELVEELVSATSTARAPWIPLASGDPRYRDLTIGRTLQEAIRHRLDERSPPRPIAIPSELIAPTGTNILDTLDLSKALDEADYRNRLKKEQRRLTSMTLGKKFEDRALVAVFEGNDASGKGGSIRRVVQGLDPRITRVIPTAAPSDEERAQPYLWRFWRQIPRRGHVAIFDRCWYGRVLVERVEGFCSEEEWVRAYEEIRAFEAELAAYGIIVMKFWLSIDKDEQLNRFKEREKVGYKRYKVTEEDWRNRDKWDEYARAVHAMVDRTSTIKAPWTLVEANNKYYARIKVLETINDRLETELR